MRKFITTELNGKTGVLFAGGYLDNIGRIYGFYTCNMDNFDEWDCEPESTYGIERLTVNQIEIAEKNTEILERGE